MANFPVNPLPLITAHATIEDGPEDRIQRSMLVVGDPPLAHEECAIVLVNPPISDNLRRSTLTRIVNIIEGDFHLNVVQAEINALGVGLVTFDSPEIRDLMVRESPQTLDEESTFSFVNHDEGINQRLPVFEYEAWVMFLSFPADYLTDHYVNKAVSLFGKLILWHNPSESKSRVLVKVLLKNLGLVPRSLLVTRVNSMPGHGMSWSVPVYILNGRHARPGLLDTEEPAPPLNASPHPFAPPVGQDLHMAVEMFNQQHAALPDAQQWGNWPEVPVNFHGINLRQIFGYDGPSMMDGIQQNPNVSDDALDAWHEHVIKVEQAADAVLTGEATNLIFIRADGLALEFAVP
jgi:hypothetical protein